MTVRDTLTAAAAVAQERHDDEALAALDQALAEAGTEFSAYQLDRVRSMVSVRRGDLARWAQDLDSVDLESALDPVLRFDPRAFYAAVDRCIEQGATMTSTFVAYRGFASPAGSELLEEGEAAIKAFRAQLSGYRFVGAQTERDPEEAAALARQVRDAYGRVVKAVRKIVCLPPVVFTGYLLDGRVA